MSTQIFLSWSGQLSHDVATIFHEWIPTVLQSAEPFLSSTDIEKGSRWSDHVAQKLEECGFGVIVLTNNNLSAPWILFEAGALSKMVGKGQVSSVLIGVDVVDVKLPLSQFQNTVFSQDDMFKLLNSINRAGQNPLKDDVLLRAFNALWPDFCASVQKAIEKNNAGVVLKTETNSSPESDVDSIKTSIGELIQSVQSLKRDNGRLGAKPSDLQAIMREVRFASRRAQTLPGGLDRDVASALKILENERNLVDETTSISNEVMEDIISKLSRASRYIQQHVERRDAYSLNERRPLPLELDVVDDVNGAE